VMLVWRNRRAQFHYRLANEIARDTCESNSDDPSSLAFLGGALAEAGRLDEALRVARAAVDAAPKDVRVHGALATVYIKMVAWHRTTSARYERPSAPRARKLVGRSGLDCSSSCRTLRLDEDRSCSRCGWRWSSACWLSACGWWS
jgi:hypothetical protein